VFDIPWNDRLSYGDVRRQEEIEHSVYSFRAADVEFLRREFARWEAETGRLLALQAGDEAERRPVVLPALEAALKCSHLFNVLEARGAFSVAERAASIQRIRRLACDCASAYLEQREALGFPLLEGGVGESS
jgi:glycyl-tRNA synthetase alpha chain